MIKLQDLFQRLKEISQLGSQGWTSLENVRAVLTKLKDWLYSQEDDGELMNDDAAATLMTDTKAARQRMQTALTHLLSCVDVSTFDARLECGCFSVVILQEILQQLELVSSRALSFRITIPEEVTEKKTQNNHVPPAPPSLISIQQTKVAVDALRVAMYTSILGCLDAEASLYVKITLARTKFVLGPDLVVVPQSCQHDLLAAIMKIILPVMRDGVWLKKGCRALVVRRFLMKPGGIEAVVHAGLSICDQQDWQHCEAVAAVIAQAKTSDVNILFASLGPQLWELIKQDNLTPEVFRIVSLVVAKLAERSATMTALHVTSKLIQPLLDTTHPNAVSLCENSNLTLCISRVHKLFVEIPPPSPALTHLLRPILKPLVTVAALATTHLRSLARQIIVRYLSQLSQDDVVESLLVMSNLKTSAESAAVNPEIRFSIDDDGGLKVDTQAESHTGIVLEEDENLSICLISILETLKNSAVVLQFYEKLAFCIDFTTLNRKEVHSRILLTDEDLKMDRFEALRKIVITFSLLTHLSENEQVIKDLFINLSAALPVVSTFIKVSCQKCEDEQQRQIQISLIMNVLMLIFCYASERSSRKKMSSQDWVGLKDLLPYLEEVAQSKNNEGILLLVEQLRNLVLTHGVVEDTNIACENVKIGNVVKNHERRSTTLIVRVNGAKESNTDASVKVDVSSSSENFQENMNAATSVSEMKPKTSWTRNTFEEAMEDLFSPLLPIRGHAILTLGKLIQKRDKETLSHKEHLLSIFQFSLKEEDSYLYLMAVEGLAVLGDAFPDEVVKVLTQEFSTGNRSVEDRAKLAEALTRTTRRLGSLLPNYKGFFINAFLTGVRDKETIVRTASLSALGDVCKLLHFSLGPIVHEVFEMLDNVVKNDDDVGVRRAALLVVTLLLQGLGCDTFTVLKDVMRDLYRSLRFIHFTDTDDVVRLHAQLAMTEIDTITKQFLLPRLSLTKRIYVADLPPNTF
ncbi:transport and Golgi organization protein 6 homolog isoform X2 [Panulirus ornatus]|uniref:transport and Golgi organization protein 6 homolog isoform X2 n=1 Tax=Panulirus ornatus TaxID=150431 RepID=UPI003A840F5E